jgi:hypothetical protein
MSKAISVAAPSVCDPVTSETRSGTKFRLQLVIVTDSGQEQVQEVVQLEREEVRMETLGLTLAEGKLILKKIQEAVVQEQVHDALVRRRNCRSVAKRVTARAITMSPCALCLGT